MFMRVAAVMVMGAAVVATVSAQQKKSDGTKSVTYEVTVTADDVYTGTMELLVSQGKVTGTMKIVTPTEITGNVAGTSEGGALILDFPYRITERNCDGTVQMNIPRPAKPGAAAGTMSAVGCGREESDRLAGTVELKPVLKK